MAQVKVVWTLLALEDLNSAYEYLQEERPSSIRLMGQRIEKALQALSRHPFIGRSGRVLNTKELVIPGTPFILPYRLKKERIEILAFMHGARRWPDEFLSDKTMEWNKL